MGSGSLHTGPTHTRNGANCSMGTPPGEIPPKDQIEWRSPTDYITMNLDTFKNLQDWETADLAEVNSSPVPRVCAYLTCGGSVTLRMDYEDVFHKKHEMQWTERLVAAHIAVLTQEEKNQLKQR